MTSPQEAPITQPNNSELIYGMDARPKPHIAFFAAFQHLLAIIVPIITPGFLICNAVGLNDRDTSMILSMSLVISGIATFVQCRKFGPLGAGLLIVQGTSFNFVGPLIAGGVFMVEKGVPAEQVMATIFGVVIAGSFIEMGVSRILPFVRRMVTPLVTGIVVLIIGLSLIKEGLISMGGGYAAMKNGTFASPDNLILSLTVFILIIIFNRMNYIWLRSSAIMLALVVGYILAALMRDLNLVPLAQAPIFEIPRPMHFGISFSWSLFIPMIVIYLVTSLEAVGDITATSKISKEPVEGPKWMERIKGGVLVNGANSLLAGFFNTFPSSVFAQNNGIIQLTGVASRYVGLWIAAILVILGLFPIFSAVIQSLPEAALGGATLIMFGSVAASGINILSSINLDRRALLIIAVSLALGLGIAQVPQFIEAFPISVNLMISHLFSWVGIETVPSFISAVPVVIADLMRSPLAMGGVTAILLNLFIPESEETKAA
ncbi:nucleobase:cation symporter-2 family protein [Bartonella sp. HY038]|uniref:nucleobase:cation symporter-2 family protein n=1 Tax=Bartonella sp. HY038 TaxID=2759660 RepID=UPI0015FC2116|nr:nucleobase:cation symporter-2 family protein [Bartonella sp. HY038]